MLTNGSGILKRWKWFSSAAMASLVATHWCLWAGTGVTLATQDYLSDDYSNDSDVSETKPDDLVVTDQDFALPTLSESDLTVSITDAQNQPAPIGNVLAMTPPYNTIVVMDMILRILVNDNQIQNYVQYWNQVMSNASSRDLANIVNNQRSKFYLLVANQESATQSLTLGYKDSLNIKYEVLNKPGSLADGYITDSYTHSFNVNEHAAGIMYDLYTVSMQWVNPMKKNWTVMLGSQWNMSRNIFVDSESTVAVKNEAVGMGIDMMLHFRAPEYPFFFFSRSGTSYQRQNISTSHVLFDNDVDKNKANRSYFMNVNVGAGYVINTGKSQDLTASVSLGLAYLSNNEYQIYWDKIYNFDLIAGYRLDDAARKDWSVKVKSNNFTYMPLGVSLQWKKQNFRLTKEKKLAGISPQISIGASWNLFNSEKNKYEVEFLGKWSDLDRFATSSGGPIGLSNYRDISAVMSRKLPEMSKWMIHAEMSVHFSTEVVPDAKLGLIISMNDKVTKYVIEMVMSLEM